MGWFLGVVLAGPDVWHVVVNLVILVALVVPILWREDSPLTTPLELIMLKGKRRQNEETRRRKARKKLFGWQQLEARQMLAADTELLVTYGGINGLAGPQPVVDLTTPSGTVIETLAIDYDALELPQDVEEQWEDTVVDGNGDLWLLTRSELPRLFQISRPNGLGSAQVEAQYALSGFTMSGTPAVPTDLAIHGRSLFVLDNLDVSSGAIPGTAGLVEFDIETGTSQVFAQGKDYTSLSVGLDGLLYAAGKENVVQAAVVDNVVVLTVTFELDVYDPDTLQLVETRTPTFVGEGTVTPQWLAAANARLTSFAVDHDGSIVAGFDGGGLAKYDVNDSAGIDDIRDLTLEFASGIAAGVSKMNLSADGDLVFSGRNSGALFRGSTTLSDGFTLVGTRAGFPPAVTFNEPATYAGNAAPQAIDDVFSVAEQYGDLLDVLGNDSDPDGDMLDVLSATLPANGTATVNEDGTITYVPNPGFLGIDSFDYTIADEQGARSTATITVTVEEASAEISDLITAVETLPDSPSTFLLNRWVSVIERRLEAGRTRYAVISLAAFQRRLNFDVIRGFYTQADIQEAYDIAGSIREGLVDDDSSLAALNDLVVRIFNL